VIIAGNHDFLFEDNPGRARAALGDGKDGLIYLQDELVEVEGLKVFGSPWSTYFMDWAFGVREREYEEVWGRIPEGLDILITHGPPLRILDSAPNKFHLGDPGLLKVVQERAPRLHVFGHIHHSHGTAQIGQTLFVNAAVCDELYAHTQPPIVLDLRKDKVMELRS